MTNVKQWMWVLLIPGLFLGACNSDADSESDEGPLAIVGEYEDSFAGKHTVTADSWTAVFAPMTVGDDPYTATVKIEVYDNNARYLVGENEGSDSWSRYDWTYEGDDLYYCQIEFAAAGEEDAIGNDTADRSDLATGCGGFSWTQLIPLS